MSDAYGFLAPIYQPLSSLVFGQDLIHANQAFLEGNQGRNVLIIGGGDGVAYRDFVENLSGEFWDLSSKMTEVARKNLIKSNLKIQTGSWPGFGKFNRIYLPFVLDTMPDHEIGLMLSQIRAALLPEGKVVVSDFFRPKGIYQELTQKFMIEFFRIVTHHRRKDLPDLNSLLKKERFELVEEKIWRKGWIRAQAWQKV